MFEIIIHMSFHMSVHLIIIIIWTSLIRLFSCNGERIIVACAYGCIEWIPQHFNLWFATMHSASQIVLYVTTASMITLSIEHISLTLNISSINLNLNIDIFPNWIIKNIIVIDKSFKNIYQSIVLLALHHSLFYKLCIIQNEIQIKMIDIKLLKVKSFFISWIIFIIATIKIVCVFVSFKKRKLYLSEY